MRKSRKTGKYCNSDTEVPGATGAAGLPPAARSPERRGPCPAGNGGAYSGGPSRRPGGPVRLTGTLTSTEVTYLREELPSKDFYAARPEPGKVPCASPTVQPICRVRTGAGGLGG